MYSFEDLVESQLKARQMMIASGVPEDVANRMFVKNVNAGVSRLEAEPWPRSIIVGYNKEGEDE